MTRKIFILFSLFIFPIFGLVPAPGAEPSGRQPEEFPRSFLLKIEGSLTVRRQAESLSLRAEKATVEEILQKIADEKKVTLKFYCQDPALNQERAASTKISADSVLKALRQILPEDYKFVLLDRQGQQTEKVQDIGEMGIFPDACAGKDSPVRIFVAGKEHPLLRKLPQEISVDALGEIIRKEGPVSRRRAAEILRAKNDEKGIPYALEALKDDNYGVMMAGAGALRSLGLKYGPEKVSEAVYARFREKPYPELLPIMAELDKEKIWPMIDGLLGQSGEKEKGVITTALLLTNDRRAIKYLSSIAETSMENSRQAIHGMGRIGGIEAADALRRLLREDSGQRQAWAAQAVRSLSQGDGLYARSDVEEIVRGEKVSESFLKALVEVSYSEPLLKLMNDPGSKPDQKIRVLNAAGQKGLEKNSEIIKIGLRDPNPLIRAASVDAMGIVVSEEAVPYLIEAAEDKDATVRRAAVKGLSKFTVDDPIVSALGKAVRDEDENVRRGALDGLYALGKPNEAMVAILKECEDREDPYLQRKATAILKFWGLK